MKFGKVLQQSQTVSSSEWESFWVDYKLLKHIIKDCAQIQKEEKLEGTTLVKTKIKPHPKEDNDSIRTSADEMNFFRTLRSEIKKIGDFFLKAQAAYISRVQAIEEQYVQLQSDPKPANKTGLMKSCVTLYKELLLLENFAVMNFCGISKILKKHDKWTGYATRNKFMRTILMKQPFATYLPLLQMIDRLEHIFMEATGCSIDQHDTSRRRTGQSTPTTSTTITNSNNSNNSNNGTGSATSSPVRHPTVIPVAPAPTPASNRPSRPGERTAQGAITGGGVASVAGVAAGDVGYDSPVTLGRVHALRDDARHFRQIERVDESYDGDDSGDSADDATLQGGRSPSSERDSSEKTVAANTTTTTAVDKTTSTTTSTISMAATTTVKAAATSTGMGLRKSYNSDSDAAAIAMLSMKEAAAAAASHSSAAYTGMRSGSDSEGSARFKRKACSPLTPAMASNGKRKMSFATILN